MKYFLIKNNLLSRMNYVVLKRMLSNKCSTLEIPSRFGIQTIALGAEWHILNRSKYLKPEKGDYTEK